MAVLSDFLIADRQESTAILQVANPSAKWPSAQFKGLSEVNLCQLWAILKAQRFSVEDLKQFANLSNDSENGPWLIIVPSELSNRIAKIPPASLQEISTKWAQTEEFGRSGWTSQEVASLLNSLKKLSTDALANGKSLMLWVSL